MMQKKLILFMPLIGGGGVEKNLYIISDFLSKKYNNIYVCTCSKKTKKKFNKKIKFITTNSDLSNKLSLRLQYLIGLFLLIKFLMKNKNSIVFAFQANIYCIFLCNLLGVKIIARINASPSGWYKNTFLKLIYKKIISMADKVIVNSKDFKLEMENIFNINVNFIYNPLDFNKVIQLSKKKINYNFFNDKKTLKLINIGRLTKQKDQITILKALKLLKNKINFKLLIIGSGLEKNNLSSYLLKNKLNEKVKIINFRENPFNLLNKADIFILSSKYEGLPNVLLEAAVLKKLIISTNCPTGPREILENGKGGIFFKIGDHHDLSNKIKFYLVNKKKFNKKILHSFKSLKRFDYNKNLNKYYYIINAFM